MKRLVPNTYANKADPFDEEESRRKRSLNVTTLSGASKSNLWGQLVEKSPETADQLKILGGDEIFQSLISQFEAHQYVAIAQKDKIDIKGLVTKGNTRARYIFY